MTAHYAVGPTPAQLDHRVSASSHDDAAKTLFRHQRREGEGVLYAQAIVDGMARGEIVAVDVSVVVTARRRVGTSSRRLAGSRRRAVALRRVADA